jgi:hypothetical protein
MRMMPITTLKTTVGEHQNPEARIQKPEIPDLKILQSLLFLFRILLYLLYPKSPHRKVGEHQETRNQN